MQKDLHDNLKISVALEAQLIDADDDFDGEIIDVQSFESLEFAVQAGGIDDGTFDATLFESDADDMTGATEVAAADLFGSLPSFDDGDSNTVQKFGYRGSKRYVRLRVTSDSTTDGGTIGALAIQGAARNAPVS
jgi:hypothetical protein